jgi:hypothetical protein
MFNYDWYVIEIPSTVVKCEKCHVQNNHYNTKLWIENNIEYSLYANRFQSAQKTLDERKANCANIALVKLALMYKLTGIKGKLYYGWLDSDMDVDKIGGWHYETSFYNMKGFKLYESIEFDNIPEYIYYRQ